MSQFQNKLGIKFVSISLIIGSVACSIPTRLTRNPSSQTPAETHRIVIIGTNDIHGQIFPEVRSFSGGKEIELGGAVWLSSYINTFHKAYPNQVLWLDAGDQFQGTLDSNPFEGASVVQVLNHAKLNASALGNHEFDFGPVGPDYEKGVTSGDVLGSLKLRMKESKYNWLAANVFLKSNLQKRPKLPNFQTSKIYQVGKVKVGVIGLSTESTPTTTRAEFVRDLVFTPLKKHAVEEATRLRKNGAEIVVVVAHVGLKCQEELAKLPERKKTEAQAKRTCGENHEMTALLNNLPQEAQNRIDAVVSGHSHSVVNHFVNGIPVIQSGGGGKMIHAIHLEIDSVTKKLIRENTAIEGPIPLCSEVSPISLDCLKEESKGWVAPQIGGVSVSKDLSMEKLVAPIFEKTAKIKLRVVAEADRELNRNPNGESALGNMIADSVRESIKADIGIVNAFGIRSNIDKGPITYGEVFNSLPFDNFIARVDVTGEQLLNILRIATSGANGIFATSGLEVTIDRGTGIGEDLNLDGEISVWEYNRLILVRLRNEDGTLTAIEPDKIYNLAMNDFLLEGGDNLLWATSQISENKKHPQRGGIMRDAFEAYLKKLGHVNTAADPAVNPKEPRLIFQ